MRGYTNDGVCGVSALTQTWVLTGWVAFWLREKIMLVAKTSSSH